MEILQRNLSLEKSLSGSMASAQLEGPRVISYKDAVLDPKVKGIIDFHNQPETRIVGPLEVISADGYRDGNKWKLNKAGTYFSMQIDLSEEDLREDLYINIKQFSTWGIHHEYIAKMGIHANGEQFVANHMVEINYSGPNTVGTDVFLIPRHYLKSGENIISISASSPHWIGNPQINYYLHAVSITKGPTVIVNW